MFLYIQKWKGGCHYEVYRNQHLCILNESDGCGNTAT